VEQRQSVGDARDEPAQAGEQQQFFDLPDHDVLPGEGPGHSNNEERELGFRAALDSVKDRGEFHAFEPSQIARRCGRVVLPRGDCTARALAALLSYASAVRTGEFGTYAAVCSKWDTLLGNNKKNRTAVGTE
jgi:hypothetical protein